MSRRRILTLTSAVALVVGLFAGGSPALAASKGTIQGTVTFHNTTVSDVHVEYWRTVRGGNLELVQSIPISSAGGSFSKNLPSGRVYLLRISGTVTENGKSINRAWWWRGSNNTFGGGGRSSYEARPIKAPKNNGTYTAPFIVGSISGTVYNEGVNPSEDSAITVAAPPLEISKEAARRRALDIENCANIFGRATTAANGSYKVNFLPASGEKQYMVLATPPGQTRLPVWNNAYGSCYSTLKYKGDVGNLIKAFNGTGGTGQMTVDLPEKDDANTLTFNVDSSGWSWSSRRDGDMMVRVRERIKPYTKNGKRVPGQAIDEQPIIIDRAVTEKGGKIKLQNLPEGRFTIEIARPSGCTSWLKSIYPNNSAYFKGLDRKAESWKAFPKRSWLKRKSLINIAKANDPNPSLRANYPGGGYDGWMYREYCPTIGAGKVFYVPFDSFTSPAVDRGRVKVNKGASVSGRVTRTGGRSNKEMMVRLTTTDGGRVLRSDITDSSGYFKITGLAPGSYRIGVNTDSWRGIARTFTGRETISVSGNNSYSAGTLNLKG